MLAGLVAAGAGAGQPASAAVSPGSTDLVSVRSDGVAPQQSSAEPAISADGRFAVFSSREALDMDALTADVPRSQVFVRDLVDGRTRLLTFGYELGGDQPRARPAAGDSGAPAISADGRFVAVHTSAPLAGSPPDGRSRIVRIDRDPDGDGVLDEPLGATIELGHLLLSEDSAAPRPAFRPSISADGQVVAYEEQVDAGVTRLAVSTLQPALARRVLLPRRDELWLVNAWAPALSGDGRRVVAMAEYVSPPVIGAAAAVPGLAVVGFDLAAVAADGTVVATRLDVDTAGLAFGLHLGGNRPLLSHDGARVVFELSVPLSCPGCEFPIYVPRAFAGSPDPDGDGAIGPAVTVDTLSLNTMGESVSAIMPAVSGDGRYAAFVTDAPGAHNGVDRPYSGVTCTRSRPPGMPFTPCQVIVRDLVLDAARATAGLARLPGELATPSVLGDCSPTGTCASNGPASSPVLSGNGGVVVFTSAAPDLRTGDGNGVQDVFARRFTPGLRATGLDFGGVRVGDELSLATAVTPVGFGPLVLAAPAVSGADFGAGPHTCGFALHAGDSCAVSVVFAPGTPGGRTGWLDLHPAGAPVVRVPLRGQGSAFPQPDPAFVVEPAVVDFGERLILAESPPAQVSVRNQGKRPLRVAAVSLPVLPAPRSDYQITADTCTGAVLTFGGSCQVTLVHRPLGPGARPAVLRLDQQTPAGLQPHLVQLVGAGTNPVLRVNPAVVPAGRPTTVSGMGFPAGREVTIGLPGFPEQARVVTDAAGAFNATLLVYPNSVPGSRQVRAAVDVVVVAGTLLVVPGTLGPPDFLARR